MIHALAELFRALRRRARFGLTPDPANFDGFQNFEEKLAGACSCPVTVLEADILQEREDAWQWDIYDFGCDDEPRIYVIGCSATLDDAHEHILQAMCELTSHADLRMQTELQMSVMHHVEVPVQHVSAMR